MSNELVYFSNIPLRFSRNEFIEQIPGIENYRKFANFFHPNIAFNDRTGTIKFPFSLQNTNPIPKFDNSFSMSYKDCVLDRMSSIDKLHKDTGKKFRLLYSGGIDTSLIFAGFVEYYGLEKTKEILEISCSIDSIYENPWLWDRYIRKENFDIITSHEYPYYWNDNKIILMGEGNDQLFGYMEYAKLKKNYKLYDTVSVKDIELYLTKGMPHPDSKYVAEKLLELMPKAPIPITNSYLAFWWIRFAIVWDGVLTRVLSQSAVDQLPKDTLHSGLVQFFNTENFQKWSLKFHYDKPDSFCDTNIYKQECKDIIIDVLKIPEYASKGKFDSFPRIHSLKPSCNIIDTDLKLYRNYEDYLTFANKENSFL